MEWKEILVNAGVLLTVVGALWRLIRDLKKHLKEREKEIVAHALERNQIQADMTFIKEQVSNHIPTQLLQIELRLSKVEDAQEKAAERLMEHEERELGVWSRVQEKLGI